MRKAPGQDTYDYGHSVLLRAPDSLHSWALPATARERPLVLERLMSQCRQDSDPPALPRGLTVCVSLTATHGDLYYVGLNAIELYDEAGLLITIRPEQVVAVPESINQLDEVSDDCRTSDKIVDGVKTTWDATHMWLAPYSRTTPTHIYFIFQEPVTLSMIKIWNYARTPTRGASETYIWMDGALVYAGYLRAAPQAPVSAAESSAPCFGQSIMLHSSSVLLAAERANVHSVREEQHCLLVNERKVVEGESIVRQEKLSATSAKGLGQRLGTPGAPGVSGSSLQRPVTSIQMRS